MRAQRTLTSAASAACVSVNLEHDALAQIPAPFQTERRVSVKIHPVSSLGLSRLVALSLQGGPDGPTYSEELHLDRAGGFAALELHEDRHMV